jgi:hypothetical protein
VARPCAPSTQIWVPLIQLARSDSKNVTTSATSSGVPRRPNGKQLPGEVLDLPFTPYAC